MKTIWKATIPFPEVVSTVTMPQGSRLVSADMTAPDVVSLWFEVDSDKPSAQHAFRIVGTGHARPTHGRFVQTLQDPPFVWHVYDLGQQPHFLAESAERRAD